MSDTIKQVVPGIIEVNSSTLVIGPTGSGKSFLLATAYEYVWEQYKKISLHYNADPGGFPDKLRALAAVGIVRIWRMQARGVEYSFETCQLAARGYWPAVIDPKSGMSPKNVSMIPPVVTTYIEVCKSCGNEAGRSIVSATLFRGTCPHCKAIRSAQTNNTRQIQTISKGFENVGTRGYDGLTSISDWYMQDMSHRVELGGEQSSLGGKINSGSLSWQQNNRAQVGFAQSRAHELVTSSLEIPGMVVMPLWTAISEESSDEGGLPCVGPKLAGSAKTDIAPQWFGNVFESRLDKEAQTGRKQRKLYLSSFIDEQNRNHLLRHRGDSRLVPEVVMDEPYDALGNPPAEIGTQFNLGYVFRQLDASLQKTVDDVAARYPDAPGLENVPSHYGMDVPAEALQTPAVVVQSAKPVVTTPSAPRAPKAPARKTAAPVPAVAAQEPEQTVLPEQPAEAPTSPGNGDAAPPVIDSAATIPSTPTPQAATVEPVKASPSAGAWAPPPGARGISPPRAPAAPPKARPVSRPVMTTQKPTA